MCFSSPLLTNISCIGWKWIVVFLLHILYLCIGISEKDQILKEKWWTISELKIFKAFFYAPSFLPPSLYRKKKIQLRGLNLKRLEKSGMCSFEFIHWIAKIRLPRIELEKVKFIMRNQAIRKKEITMSEIEAENHCHHTIVQPIDSVRFFRCDAVVVEMWT